MRIAFLGSSLLSAYWNGAATYYRGLLRHLAERGHDITFFEPDAFDRQAHRDMSEPEWARVVVWPATPAGLDRALGGLRDTDVAIKASGVGVFDDVLVEGVLERAPASAVRIFWDVDAPATLAAIGGDARHPLRRALPAFDAVLTYGGGDPVVDAYRAFGARFCLPIYNGLDPESHFPVPADPRFDADLVFLGNRLPDREERVDAFFLEAARLLPERRFLLGGSGWDGADLPHNVKWLGHVRTRDHNAFNGTPLAVLNIARDSMAAIGFSPATRVFEAAGAGACLITDAWPGLETFLRPGEEVLVAENGRDVARHLQGLTRERARQIGARARARALRDHTYAGRAAQVDAVLRDLAPSARRHTTRIDA
ncbi:MAG: glycosyltransferase [Geminicoccaceae bacterium]|nr:glycosyltransferase [Geminicoccaceae bacterium]